MAAAPALLLWLLAAGAPWRVRGQREPGGGRRFSEHKLCADGECSMLMYRGEALEDFTGPDCRFVSFKKGDPVYVYYKLAGRGPEVWAGSVGRIFGYFPKDLIQVIHEYTKEELQVPTDETDFVCFDGGRDDFDNYNVEELLGFLELYDSAAGDSAKAAEETDRVEPPPGVSEESEAEPGGADPEGREGLFPGSTEDLEEPSPAQKSRAPASSHAGNAQGEQPSFEPFAQMLQERLKVPESEKNRSGNSSQASAEQEKMDAYKLLKTEMTLDLKTKFGSTADALVSDDETTSLVTSPEDDFDEDLDAAYYAVEKEEEEDQEDFEQLPLLTFVSGEDSERPATPGAEKYSSDEEQNANEKDELEGLVAPGIKNGDANILTAWGDTIFSIVTGGEEKTGVADSESSDSEEEKEDEDASAPGSKRERPPSTAGHTEPGGEDDGLLTLDVPKTNSDRDPEADSELHIKGKGRKVQEPERSPGRDETELEDEKRDGVAVHGSTQSSHRDSLPAADKGGDTAPSAFGDKDDDLEGAAVHVSKETRQEDKPAEQTLGGGSGGDPGREAQGNQTGSEKTTPAHPGPAAPAGDTRPHTPGSAVREAGALPGGPKPHRLPVERPREASEEDLARGTHSQPRSSSPGDTGSPGELGEEGPVPGTNLSWPQEGAGSAVIPEPSSAAARPSEDQGREDPGREDPADEEFAGHKAARGTQELGGAVAGAGVAPEDPAAEEDDDLPEELLEDENAASAKQAKENGPGGRDGQADAHLQVPEGAVAGTPSPDPEDEGNRGEASVSGSGRNSETAAAGVDTAGGGPASLAGEKQGGPLLDEKAQRPPEVSDFPDQRKTQAPEVGDASPNEDSDDPRKDNSRDPVETSGLAEKLGRGELSGEDREDAEKSVDTESQGSASGEREDDPSLWTPQTTAEPAPGDTRDDLPIIGSFFGEQQSLQRFQKYFDAHELEFLLQEMSFRLQAAQRDSLPYNVEKVLDKVFRASESHILSVAEKMLDARVARNRDEGMQDSNVFEESAALDDIQDLVYFVRYRHSAEEQAPLAMAPPLEEGWGQTATEMQPPHEDHFSPENMEELTMQIPEEPTQLDQPVTRDTGASEVSQQLNTEKDLDPGLMTTAGAPVDAVDAKKQLEINAEEPAGVTPLENAILLIYSFMFYLSKTIVATLPDDVQPGPDFYGLPWKPVLITAFLGIVSFAVFFWRTILVVKNRVYQVTEQQISEKLKTIMKENAELVQKLSNYEQKIKESKKHVQEAKKQNMILSDEAIKFKDKIKRLEETNESLDDTAKNLRVMLESEREQNVKNQDLILENKKSIEKLKDVISMNASEFSEVQIALNEAKLSEEKVKSECHRVQEENARLKKKKEQLQQEIEDWSKSHAELSEQIKSFEKSQKDFEGALAHKDDNINALTNCITQLNRLECECESESEGQNKGASESDELANGEVGGDRNEKMKNQIKQMMDVSWTQTAVSVVEEDLKLLQSKLRASMSTKCDLEDQIKTLEDDRNSLQSAKARLEDECKTLRQKVEILNELYQQKEMALQKKLSQEEYERQEREQRLSAADEKAVLAAEEVKTYKRRIEEMEDELQKTERSFKTQIATHEKKAHDNWLKARAAERAIAEEKREAANLRHKILELTQKMAMLQEEPVIVKPMPARPNTHNPPRRGALSQNGSFGPSPVSGGDCSPPPTAEPPVRPLSATLSRREMPRSEFGSVDGPVPRARWSSEAPGKPPASDPGAGTAATMNSSSRNSSPTKVMDEGQVPMAAKGPPPYPGVPLMGSPVGGPLPPPPIRYGPPPQLCGPFGPRPLPPPFGPALRPPLGLREYAPGVPPGKRDLPLDPREFLPGHAPFRPLGSLGPREYFIPGPRLPPPGHGPQDYPAPPAARDLPPSGSRAEPPPAPRSSDQDCPQALRQSP
ncbi:transport and Golgi organization protein 1 homolog isoform X2 [Eulemur rufifrons]|uniref:transport and Golgi organization protein 1 homolog isoform X2 n=1 Tax=Eulemur rufifrons TaxID=859984 RepID=UPI003743DF56